jgi:hypothetical protein
VTVANDFATLFQGNPAATGTEEGGCDRSHRPHDERINDHLGSGEPIGIYPMVHEHLTDKWWVWFSAVDFDEGEEISRRHATALAEALRLVGLTGWVERSRSKGYHVWLYHQRPVEAVVARHALLWVCEVVNVPTKEVNPKQVSLQPGQLGNYIRIPYPGYGAMPDIMPPRLERRVVLSPSTGLPLSLSAFVRQAMASRATPEQIAEVAARYKPPVRHVPRHTPETLDLDVEELLEQVPKVARKIWHEGPLPGGDRSSAMFKLASLIWEADVLSYDDTYTLLQAAPWQKFQGRADEDTRIHAVLGRVWGT